MSIKKMNDWICFTSNIIIMRKISKMTTVHKIEHFINLILISKALPILGDVVDVVIHLILSLFGI